MPDIGRRQLHWAPDADVEVLVRGWDNPLRHTQVAEQWHAPPGMGEEDALVWTNRYGAGRVFATGIGHGPEALSYSSFQGLFTRGAEWAGRPAACSPSRRGPIGTTPTPSADPAWNHPTGPPAGIGVR